MVNNHILQGINHDIKVIKFTPFSHTLVLNILPLNQGNNITFKYYSMINFNNSLYFFTLRFHYSTEPIYYVSLCFHTNFLFTKLSIFMLIVHFRTSPKPMISLFTVYLHHILIPLYQEKLMDTLFLHKLNIPHPHVNVLYCQKQLLIAILIFNIEHKFLSKSLSLNQHIPPPSPPFPYEPLPHYFKNFTSRY